MEGESRGQYMGVVEEPTDVGFRASGLGHGV